MTQQRIYFNSRDKLIRLDIQKIIYFEYQDEACDGGWEHSESRSDWEFETAVLVAGGVTV